MLVIPKEIPGAHEAQSSLIGEIDLVLKAIGRVSQTTAEVVLWPIHARPSPHNKGQSR